MQLILAVLLIFFIYKYGKRYQEKHPKSSDPVPHQEIIIPDEYHSMSDSDLLNSATSGDVHAPLLKTFDSTNPHEIYDVVKYLSTIVANKGDSGLYVYLQDENPSKGWDCKMGLLVNIDDWRSDGLRLDSASFVKLGLSLSAAQYLASVPFAISGDDLKYDFPTPFDYPSTHARFIVEEMEKGTRSSGYVQHGIRRIKIENNHGVISCKSD